MKFPKVIYKKNFVIGKNLYEHFTIEVDPEGEETPEECYDKAKEIVEKQFIRNNYPTTADVIQKDLDDLDHEYPIFKELISSIPDREDAQKMLITSAYYNVLELKMIVKNKPSKYE